MSAAIEIKGLSLRVNGAAVGPIPVPVGTSLLDVLHEWLGLTGSRMGCGQGICHACTVMLEEAAGPREMRACITGAHWFEGRSIRTVEGQARTFADAVGVSGIVLAKLDGTAKGGIAFAIAHDLGIPVRFIGTGEKLDDLAPFDAQEFVSSLLN